MQAAGKTYTGVLLWDVLATAGLAPTAVQQNPTLSMYVLATGADGYQVLFSVAELDPAVGGRRALVAHTVDGNRLDASAVGPFRLVVPEDARPSRAVFRLVSLQVKTAASR